MRTEKSVEIRGFDIAEQEAITQGLVNRVASESMSIPQTTAARSRRAGNGTSPEPTSRTVLQGGIDRTANERALTSSRSTGSAPLRTDHATVAPHRVKS